MSALAGQLPREPASAWQSMPADLELKVRSEQVVGPVHGYYLACYTIETEQGFDGYAKVFANQPSGVWSARHALAKYSAGRFATSEQAIRAVIETCAHELAAPDTRANRFYRYLLRFL